MKIECVVLSLLFAAYSINAMETPLCKLPCAGHLKALLKEDTSIIEKTNIIQNLADKNLTPLQVFTFVDQAISDYIHEILVEKQDCDTNLPLYPYIELYLATRKRTIVALVLRNYPEEFATIRHLFIPKAKL